MDSDPEALLGLTVYLLSQTARLGKRALDDRLAAQDLRLRHMAVLAALDDAGPAGQVDLGRRLRIDPSDMTAVIDELEGQHLVAREVDPADRRRRVIRSTEEGTTRLRQLQAVAVEVADDLLEPLSPARRKRLHEDLSAVLQAARSKAIR